MKLNPANTRLVIAALRGGEFEQTTSYLAADGKYCCLGVACRVAEGEGVTFVIQEVEALRSGRTNLQFDGVEGELPQRAVEWLYEYPPTVDSGDPFLAIPPVLQEKACGDTGERATALNDTHEFTFSEIADCFEYTLAQQEAA